MLSGVNIPSILVKTFHLARDAMPARCMLWLCPSVYPSVRLSVASRYRIKMAKRRITQATPHDSPGTHFLMPNISGKIGDF